MTDPNAARPTQMAIDPVAARKRQIEVTLIDPDTMQEIPSAKRPRIALDPSKKGKVLRAILDVYPEIVAAFNAKATEEFSMDLHVSSQITNIIFTVHHIKRQIAKGNMNANMVVKAGDSDFKIHYKGQDYTKSRDAIEELWLTQTNANGLEYKDFNPDDPENWYGTIAPYLDFFGAFNLRMTELRVGHSRIPIQKREFERREIPAHKFGLNGAHHILMEGVTYPPERQSAMAQSLGPMTAFIKMLTTEGKYRDKWVNAVKRCMGHIETIDDIISLVKSGRTVSEMVPITCLLAEILLIATGRQATRMCFPLCGVSWVYKSNSPAQQIVMLENFNVSGRGGFATYKALTALKFWMQGELTQEKASQIAFHCIFGTYKEDLSLLSFMTNQATWYTREEFGKCFLQMTNVGKSVEFKLPELRYYRHRQYCPLEKPFYR